MILLALLATLLQPNLGLLHNLTQQVDLSGTVCQEKKVEVIPVNTTHLVVETSTQLEDCWYCFSWDHPFQRQVVRKQLKPVVTVENITKISLVPTCCSGFTSLPSNSSSSSPSSLSCVPVCGECLHGTCEAPFTCSCLPGYSGHGCQEGGGCPAGSWGQECDQRCDCRQGGVCRKEDGACLCPPGYQGARCEDQCQQGTFGEDCSSSCQCSAGHFCHHITGDCLKCSDNTFGLVRHSRLLMIPDH